MVKKLCDSFADQVQLRIDAARHSGSADLQELLDLKQQILLYGCSGGRSLLPGYSMQDCIYKGVDNAFDNETIKAIEDATTIEDVTDIAVTIFDVLRNSDAFDTVVKGKSAFALLMAIFQTGATMFYHMLSTEGGTKKQKVLGPTATSDFKRCVVSAARSVTELVPPLVEQNIAEGADGSGDALTDVIAAEPWSVQSYDCN